MNVTMHTNTNINTIMNNDINTNTHANININTNTRNGTIIIIVTIIGTSNHINHNLPFEIPSLYL